MTLPFAPGGHLHYARVLLGAAADLLKRARQKRDGDDTDELLQEVQIMLISMSDHLKAVVAPEQISRSN